MVHGNFTGNKCKCNATQQNSATRRYQRNTPEEQVQCNATQQCYKEILLEISPGATQSNAKQQCNENISELYLGGKVQHNTTQQGQKEILLEVNPSATQPNTTACNVTQQCNEKISDKHLVGTSEAQLSATVLHGNCTRNKPKHNTTQQNSGTRRYQRNTPEEQVQCNATQQCHKEILLEINPCGTQHNTTVQQEDIRQIP